MKRIGFFALLMGVLMSFTNPTGYKVGDKATDFKLKSVDNKMYSMADYKDAKGFIVVFTCNHCPFAVKYEDRIIDLAKKYKSKGYILLAINPNDPAAQPDDSFELMQKRAKEKKFTFPYLFDEGQKIYPQYGATKTPHVFLLDKNLVVKYIGAIDDNVEDASQVKEKYLENAIAALEKGEEPTPNTTKAIGCSIKVKK
ncbi:thioredoxin family protein [Flavobacterium cheniae]|jgi:peroxiredoxin|uniref:Peroxiredoxin n=1 Tax=Flavobacterium cheniae TaxID=295428 RepID=A0A562KNW5_9FLAO|nr:thioredoxin family protein [Flavobacterium cheniae]TDR23078.1 peroxiredoxin [Flavobacterium cheniae]TWH97062.1 peroxiredoxin [Flavobacterium cheniae]